MKLSDLDIYAIEHTEPDSQVLQELTAYTQANTRLPVMLCGPLVARTLQFLIKLAQAQRVLEIGCFTGYSALAMAEALPEGGEVVTLEIDPNNAQIARSFLEKSPHGPKVTIVEGDAKASLKRLSGPFDLVFIDADKQGYGNYIEEVYEKLAQGGIIALDNMLQEGRVLQPEADTPKYIDALNKKLMQDERFTTLLLPLRDGLTLLYKL